MIPQFVHSYLLQSEDTTVIYQSVGPGPKKSIQCSEFGDILTCKSIYHPNLQSELADLTTA